LILYQRSAHQAADGDHLSCVPIAVFCNYNRVTTTGVLHVQGHSELATGIAHTMLGWWNAGHCFQPLLGNLLCLEPLYVEIES
jgi:hypothetical protein